VSAVNYIKKFLGVYAAFLIQTILIERIGAFSCPPDILLTVLIICSVGLTPMRAFALGAFAGIITDAMSSRVFGINILIYMYLALFVSLSTGERTDNSPLLMSWVAFISIAALELIAGVIKAALGSFPGAGYVVSSIFVKGIFSAVFTLLFVLLCQKKKQRKTRNESDGEEGAA
jgi:rod shape-determining protein MreD